MESFSTEKDIDFEAVEKCLIMTITEHSKINSFDDYVKARSLHLKTESIKTSVMNNITKIENINYESEFEDFLKYKGCDNVKELQELNAKDPLSNPNKVMRELIKMQMTAETCNIQMNNKNLGFDHEGLRNYCLSLMDEANNYKMDYKRLLWDNLSKFTY